MKTRKLFVLLMVAVLLLLTACQEQPTVPGVDSKVTYTVTKEQWDENMNAINYTMSLIASYDFGDDGEPIPNTSTMMQTDNAMASYSNGELEGYGVVKDGIAYIVMEEEGQWVGYPAEGEWYPIPLYGYLCEDMADFLNFDHFTFNETRQAYILPLTLPEDNEWVAKFENGKLVSFEKIDKNDSTRNMRIEFSNIGTTIVRVPDFVAQAGELEFWQFNDVSYSVIGIGNYADDDLVIPSTYNGLPVTQVASDAFRSCDRLVSVVIPDSVTSLGESAFENCNSLTSIIIPDSVTSISIRAFAECNSLTSIAFSGTVTQWKNIKFGVEWNYNVPATEVICSDGKIVIQGGDGKLLYALNDDGISYSVIEIDTYADGDLVIPSTYNGLPVTGISENALDNCGYKNIYIPASVTFIGDKAFFSWYDLSLTGIWVDENNPAYSSDQYGVLFNKNKTKLIFAPPAAINGSYTIPNGVTSIADDAFWCCENLTNVTIPNGVQIIGDGAFGYCHLTSIYIPASVTTIVGDNVFVGNYGLTGIWVDSDNAVYSSDESGVLFDKDKTILLEARTAVKGDYIVPSSVITIADGAFLYASPTSITFPEGLKTIGNQVFGDLMGGGCISLTSISIPKSITAIGSYAFYECYNIDSITYAGTVEQWKGIELGEGWNAEIPATEVICSDGVVSLA